MAPQAVVLDLDGTVWNSRPWYAQLIGHGDSAQASQALIALASGCPAATLLKNAGYTKARFKVVCQSAALRLACFPGIIHALEQLRDSGVKLGAATNLPIWMAGPMADASGIAPLLATLVDFTATKRHKPNPAPLIEALQRLDTTPGPTAWYVGDEYQDAVAARAGGLRFAWAAWDAASEAPEGADLILRKPADLLTLTGLASQDAANAPGGSVR
jgi:phosphoglycolate phosphatase-like HAD superfamily hydrolase